MAVNAGSAISFTKITSNLTGVGGLTSQLTSVAYVPNKTSGPTAGILYVGAQSGVYEVPTSGVGQPTSNWARYGADMPNVPVYSLEYVASQQILVAGTLGRGAFITSALGPSGGGNLTVSLSSDGSNHQATDDAGTVNLKVSRQGTFGALTVSLANSDPALATVMVGGVPATSVTIPDGSTSVTVQVTITDTALANYPDSAVFTASAAGLNSASDWVDVVPDGDIPTSNDQDLPTLTVSIAAPAVTGGIVAPPDIVTVSRNTPTDLPLFVTIVVSDQSLVSAPTTVIIPGGQSSVSFPISAIIHFAPETIRDVTITAAVSGYASGSATVEVDPFDPILKFDQTSDVSTPRRKGRSSCTATASPPASTTASWSNLPRATRSAIRESGLEAALESSRSHRRATLALAPRTPAARSTCPCSTTRTWRRAR